VFRPRGEEEKGARRRKIKGRIERREKRGLCMHREEEGKKRGLEEER